MDETKNKDAEPELMKPGEASKTLTISPPTLRGLGEKGILTVVRISTKSFRYRRDEVERLRRGEPPKGAA